jgi:hypothetical protein
MTLQEPAELVEPLSDDVYVSVDVVRRPRRHVVQLVGHRLPLDDRVVRGPGPLAARQQHGRADLLDERPVALAHVQSQLDGLQLGSLPFVDFVDGQANGGIRPALHVLADHAEARLGRAVEHVEELLDAPKVSA